MTPRDFSEPLDALLSCHRHIEEHLRMLERVSARVAEHRADSIAQSAARQVLGYFDSSGAQHQEDEDDLFPLLRQRAGAARRVEIAAAIDELEREHPTLDALWRRLRGHLADIAAVQEPPFERDDVGRFAWLYRRHMERESLLVFPYAREALGPQDLIDLGNRMAARRSVPAVRRPALPAGP